MTGRDGRIYWRFRKTDVKDIQFFQLVQSLYKKIILKFPTLFLVINYIRLTDSKGGYKRLHEYRVKTLETSFGCCGKTKDVLVMEGKRRGKTRYHRRKGTCNKQTTDPVQIYGFVRHPAFHVRVLEGLPSRVQNTETI